jgi:hypothetical protein
MDHDVESTSCFKNARKGVTPASTHKPGFTNAEGEMDLKI